MNCSQTKIKKVNKKLKKFEHVVLKETGVTCKYQPTKNLVICNAGLANGLSEETVFEHFGKCGKLESILLLPGKSCSFITYMDGGSSEEAYNKYNGNLNIAQDNKPIYILFCDHLPENYMVNKIWNDLPPGLMIIKDFITPEEEDKFIKEFDFNNIETKLSQMKHRQVKHYGYEFKYDINNVNKNEPLSNKIPQMCKCLFKRLEGTPFSNFQPDQLTVNCYQPGQGIPSHIDTHSAFEDPIMSLSLCSDVIMEFKNEEKTLCVSLPRLSLAIMSGESRYAWTHGIIPRKFDIITTKKGLSTLIRGKRISLTFRKILHGPCLCNYKEYCDLHCKETEIEKEVASKLERIHVHDVYEKIATHFSDTRNKLWSNVMDFVESFPLGSILVDVGCGNGKYLDSNVNAFKIGCDTSFGLLNVCKERGFEVLTANCLNLPIKDNIVDGAICIAVIHHLGTEERRLTALEEIVRVLKIGGKALIYVWAKDQLKDKEKSSYIKQDRKNRKAVEIVSPLNDTFEKVSVPNEVVLPVHVNRTQFKYKDVLVPWKLKNVDSETSDSTFLRYYHVFEENELANLCLRISNIVLLKHFYDQGNWCALIKKEKF